MAVAGTWASIQDVADYTGATVTPAQLNQAQQMVEALIKRAWRSSDTTTSSYYWLQRAVAWQAKYVVEHPEIIDSVPIESLSQDGFSVTYGGFAQAGIGLRNYSPITLRLLNNLFRGANTTIRFNSGFQRSGARRSLIHGSRWRRY